MAIPARPPIELDGVDPSLLVDVTRRLVATPGQQRFLVGERFGPASYVVAGVCRVDGVYDRLRLVDAVFSAFARHETLRTDFELVDGQFVARVHSAPRFALSTIHPTDPSLDAFREAALPIIFAPVDLGDRATLIRLLVAVAAPADWRLCVAVHHSLSDGLSGTRLVREIATLYSGGRVAPVRSYYDVPPPPPAALEADRAFWRRCGSAAPVGVHLPADQTHSVTDGLGRYVEAPLRQSPAELRRLARTMGTSTFGCLAAAYAIGLARATGARTIPLSFQSAGRATVGASVEVHGPFSNTLPIALEVDPAASFGDLARRAKALADEAVAHERLPYLELARLWREFPRFALNVFPRDRALRFDGLVVHPMTFLDRRTEKHLNLVWSARDEAVIGQAFYDGSRYTEARITSLIDGQIALIDRARQTPEEPVAALADAVRKPTPRPLRQTADPGPGTIIDAFLARAEASPHAPALRWPGGTCDYGRLRADAARIAAALRNAGAGPNDTVALVAARAPAFVTAVLGAALAGVPFVVLDSGHPPARLRAQIALVRPRFALAAGAPVPVWLAAAGAATVPPGDHPTTGAGRPPVPAPEEPAYLLFTSGTTGGVKAVAHPHAPLRRYVAWATRRFAIGSGDTVSLLSGLAHDPVLRDIFVPLSCGAAVAVPDPAQMADPRALRHFLADTGVTVSHLTPPFGRLLSIEADAHALDRLRLVVWGGDVLSGALVERFHALAPAATQMNLYGATETPQAALVHVIAPETNKGGDPWARVPLGRPVPGVAVDVVDNDGARCGIGELGEIRVRTAAPIRILTENGPGPQTQTHCATGDRGFFNADGSIMFAGRVDDQVKVRGFRVALDEVTAAMAEVTGVRHAIAATELTPDGDRRLLGYVEFERTGSAAALRDRLGRMLPAYMVPDRVVTLRAMPLLANGKIDRAALKRAPRDDADRRRKPPARAAETPAERDIAAVYAAVSGLPVDDVQNSLTDLGADSLSMVEARLQLEGLAFDPPEDWATLPITELAAHLDSSRAATTGEAPRWRRAVTVETFIPLRAAAILFVVAGHLEWFTLLGGMTSALFVLAGYALGAKQPTPRLAVERVDRIWSLLAAIVVTTLPVTFALWAGLHLLDRPSHPSTILFYANLAQGHVGENGRFTYLWFVHCYAQIFLLLGVLLSIRPLRAAIATHPLGAVLTALLVLDVLLLAGAATANAAGIVVDPEGPLAKSPLGHLPHLLIGVAVAFAPDARTRLLVLAAAALHGCVQSIAFNDVEPWPLLGAAALLAFVPSVKLPGVLTRPILTVAAASLYIYLLHQPMEWIGLFVLDLPPNPLLYAVATVTLSVALWELWKPVLRRLGVRRLKASA